MTSSEKQHRGEARWYGTRCAKAIEAAVFHGREAAQWRQLDVQLGLADKEAWLTTSWQQRSDVGLEAAVRHAQKAAHHARLALDKEGGA